MSSDCFARYKEEISIHSFQYDFCILCRPTVAAGTRNYVAELRHVLSLLTPTASDHIGSNDDVQRIRFSGVTLQDVIKY
jgi:hypothetical protein